LPKRIRRRNLIARIFGLHRQCEPSHGMQPVPPLLWRGRLCSPCESTDALDVCIAAPLGERNEALQQDVLAVTLEAK
jgi:hypothetical protein